MDLDGETRELLQEVAGREAGLPAGVHRRIGGTTIKQMREDARSLAVDLGLTKGQERDDGGRFSGANSTINQRIRAAAGR